MTRKLTAVKSTSYAHDFPTRSGAPLVPYLRPHNNTSLPPHNNDLCDLSNCPLIDTLGIEGARQLADLLFSESFKIVKGRPSICMLVGGHFQQLAKVCEAWDGHRWKART